MELNPKEHFIKEKIPANLFRGMEAVGGRLNITNERILFKPHKLNIQSQQLEIKLQDIAKIEKRNTMLLVPNGMKIIVTSGQEYKFVVWKRAKVIELIKSAKSNIN